MDLGLAAVSLRLSFSFYPHRGGGSRASLPAICVATSRLCPHCGTHGTEDCTRSMWMRRLDPWAKAAGGGGGL